MDNGWIKLHRAIQGNDLWNSEPFSRGQAWVDLLLLSNHKDSFFYKRGNKVTVKRGQVGRSEVELSDRWKWSRSKIRKFLKDLEKEQQIIIHKSRVTQLVTIVNYDIYQEKEQQKNNRKTTEEQQKDTYKNEKKEEEREEKNKEVDSSESTTQPKPLEFKNEYLSICKAFVDITGKGLRGIGETDAEIKESKKFAIIKARLKKKASVEDMIKVIEMKNKEWISNPDTKKWIRFSTLFGNKYEFYLDELEAIAPISNESHPDAPTDTKERFKYFRNLFLKYAPHLEHRLVNTEYKDRIYQKKDAEGLIRDLERQNPQLLEL